jgi:hypothetical protein
MESRAGPLQSIEFAAPGAFAAALKPLRRKNWFVYIKEPFAGPKAVLATPALDRSSRRAAAAAGRQDHLRHRARFR